MRLPGLCLSNFSSSASRSWASRCSIGARCRLRRPDLLPSSRSSGWSAQFPPGPGAAGLAAHFAHEWVILVNLLLLLVGFALLAAHFEESRPAQGACRSACRTTGPARSRCSQSCSCSRAFLDNIAAALIGGAMAHTLFRGPRPASATLRRSSRHRTRAASGSVIGDTTTTMMWIDGVPPIEVLHAYIAAAAAFLVFASRQPRAAALRADQKDAETAHAIDWPRVVDRALHPGERRRRQRRA